MDYAALIGALPDLGVPVDAVIAGIERVGAEQGSAAVETWVRLGVTRHRVRDLLPRVWALRENLTAYDATYVALAEALGCTLVTADARIAQAPGTSCLVSVVPG